MRKLYLILLVTVYFSYTCATKKQTCPLDDETYDTLFKLCLDRFNVPVKDRSRAQKSACVRFWRNRDAFTIKKSNGKKVLYFNGKEVMKEGDLQKEVEREFIHCKGVGARKLKHRLRERFEGVSEERIQKILSGNKFSQMANAKFRNKAISRPIRASDVQVSVLRIEKLLLCFKHSHINCGFKSITVT